ncbi:collagenase 3-like isoform X2 [Siniperca chuatsi]|uniref:collagenase 3-like isoform X2 n=1 Tax=Siniperca chuatsi TaxID=119488 RepID=UPI001CE19E3A|nr:collagenase 3-like isoform X2 [Siniperca chuatsi]
MKNSSMRSITENSFSQDLQAMQAFFGLEVTGVLNEETVEVVKAPRCGVPDINRYEHFPFKPKWGKRLITYRITQYTPDLTQRQVDATIAQAFQLYSDVIPLDFKQIYNDTADIMILFTVKYHGDFQSFDGQGGVLAHAYAPGEDEGGDTHFDDDETWTLTQGGVNLLLVAAHEFGHALGLDHSRDRHALMYPIYKYVNTSGYRLPDDDRHGIQALYVSSDPVSSDPVSSDPGSSDPGSSGPASSGPDDCCFQFYPKRLPIRRVVRYRYTDPRCSKEAVIFTMISGAELCTNPSEPWVQNIITAKEWDHTNTALGVKSN